MIKYFHKKIRDTEIKPVEGLIEGCWIEVTNAVSQDLLRISELLKIDYEDIVDSLDDLELPRIERKDGHTIIFIRIPVSVDNQIYTETFTIVFSDKNITTISMANPKIISDLHDIPMANLPATTQKSKFLAYILLKVAHDFTSKIKQLRKSVLHQRKNINAIDNKEIIRLNEVRKF